MKGISLVTNVVILLTALIGCIVCAFAMNPEENIDPVTMQIAIDDTWVERIVSFTMVLFWASIVTVAVGSIYVVIVNFKKLIPAFIGLGIFAALMLLSMMFIEVDTSGPVTELPGATERVIWWTDFGLRATYVMSIVAVIAIFSGSVMKFMRYFQK